MNKIEIETTLTNLLNDCLSTANQKHSFTVKNIDIENMKFSVDFDIVIIKEDKYIGFAGY